jgi:spermidine/putrescine-binding protein
MRQPLYRARRDRTPPGLVLLVVAALLAGSVAAADDAVVRHLVFGSYSDPANADADAAAVEAALGIDTERVEVEVDGETFVRLVSPAIEGEAIWPLSARAAEARIDAWVWRLE